MKIKLIAELGLNHFGNKKYLTEYQNFLSRKKIDGITIQIPHQSLLKKNQKKFLFDEKKIFDFVKTSKKKFNLVGITTSDHTKIDFFAKLNIDFFKVTSRMITNISLIKKMQKTKIKTIYLSTGFSNHSEIKKVLKKVTKKKISLIHTSFKKEIADLNLRNIFLLKKKFNIPVAYGNHSAILETISNSVFYEPSSIFFYVKLNQSLKYPDNKYAIKLNQLNYIMKKIKNNIMMSGRG